MSAPPPLLYKSLFGGKLGGMSTLEELEALLIMESLLELEVMDGDLEWLGVEVEFKKYC